MTSNSLTAKSSNPNNRIPVSQLAAYGAGGIIPIALFNIAGILVGLMGNISLGLSALWLGVILIIPRLYDAISDPIIGHLSDNARTRWGRRRPFIFVGGILVAITFVVLWWIPEGEFIRTIFPAEASFQAFQLVYILFALILFYTACTIFEIPHGALGMEITNDPHKRTQLFSAKSLIGNVFAMSTPWLFALAGMEIFRGVGGNEADGMRYVSMLVAALLIPLSIWWTLVLREPAFKRVAKQQKNSFRSNMKHTIKNRNFIRLTLTIFTLAMGFNFVSLLGSYIPIFYVFGGDKVAGGFLLGINGTIWAVTGVLAVFPLNWIAPKLGKRNTLILAIGFMVAAQLSKIVCYNPDMPYLIVIPTILLSAGMLFFFTLGASMVGDICDEDDLATGQRTEGSFYSVFWWFIKMGTAMASFVTGVLITFTSFDETQVTRVDALQGSIRVVRSEMMLNENVIPDTVAFVVSVEKARSSANELLSHIRTQSENTRHSIEHYNKLKATSETVANTLNSINASLTPNSIEAKLSTVESDVRTLTRQAPHTLLRMRVVEIGVPLLLSILSVLFIRRYSLSEKKSQEIKTLLKQRNDLQEDLQKG
ncbi:MAG TPA: MFS transporter [Bacteroidales bacterium]|nr:MFS transporter [Bacteroidales bacterium]